MISKSISTSTTLAEVSTFAKLLFTWLIPHCDDYGHMDGSPKLVKGIVVPLCDETAEDVRKALDELEKVALISRYEIAGKQYLEVGKWKEHQTLKTDRPLHIIYPLPVGWKPKVSKWKNKRKLSEDKLSEEEVKSGGAHSVKYLTNIPSEDIKEFMDRFIASEKEIKSKAEDLKLYCERKGRTYKNYRSFLLNALKRDFKEREGSSGKYKNL